MSMAPFVGYSDCECALKPVNNVDDVKTGIISSDPEFDLLHQENFEFPQKETYFGEDAAEQDLDCVRVTNAISMKSISKNGRK